ncbi:MAG: alpha/beta hydrolase [Candidatus Moduliflexus flocculans]|nr:alpha/beta hydrolase [Candidatus Moduliflexus flocculans]
MRPHRWSLLETRAFEAERTPDLLAQYDAWEKTAYVVRSPHGYGLKTYYVPCDDPALGKNVKFAVIAHGFSYTHLGSIKYAAMMKDLGYHVVFYDERYHGESGGTTCTLGGMRTRRPARRHRRYLRPFRRRPLPRNRRRIDGRGHGLARASRRSARPLRDLRLRLRHPPRPVPPSREARRVSAAVASLPLGEWIFKRVTRVDPANVRPIDAVARATAPILFIHGEGDRYVPTADATALYQACRSPKTLWIAKNGARHAESFRKNRTEYLQTVHRFMAEHVQD